MDMKKRLALLCMAAMFLSACGNTSTDSNTTDATPTAEKKELTVFAAASLTESLNTIKETYEKEHGIIFNCGGNAGFYGGLRGRNEEQ